MKILRLIYCLFFLSFSHVAYAQTESSIKNGTATIHYKTFGAGKPILIINGGPGMNSDGFASLAKSLSGKNKTIIYDQRGTGKSFVDKVNDSTITLQLMLSDIEVLRKHLKINSWVILGHSFGGMLASYYAANYPANTDALILSASGGIDLELLSYLQQNIQKNLSGEDQKLLDYWNSRISDGDTSYKARLNRGTALAPAYIYNKEYTAVIAERLTQGNSEVNNLVWEDMRKIKFDCSAKQSKYNKPVLIIQGKQDIIEEKTALKAKKVLKKSTVIFLDNCRHYGWLDAPEEYFNAIRVFLSKVP